MLVTQPGHPAGQPVHTKKAKRANGFKKGRGKVGRRGKKGTTAPETLVLPRKIRGGKRSEEEGALS